MARVEGLFGGYRDIQLCKEHSFDERISLIVLQPVDNSAKSINYTAHARVCSPNHRQLGLRATKDRVNGMLFRAGALEEPAVVGHRDEDLCATQCELPSEIAQRILKADKRTDLHRFLRHFQNDRLPSKIKIVRHQIADDPGEEWKGSPQRHVLPEGNQMDLVVDLSVPGVFGEQNGGIVITQFVEMHGAQQKVSSMFFRKASDA